MALKPGEIYFAALDNDGQRRVVVVSREELNGGKYVVVVPITSTRFEERKGLPNCVPFRAGQFGLTKDCVAQAEQISFLPVEALLLEQGVVGEIDEITMRSLTKAIGHMIAAECEPI
jgi:mRNA-degrading endonuclease toxin of MazEF toxin-antitoxin module